MLFEPYILWPEPCVVAYQRDDLLAAELLAARLPRGAELRDYGSAFRLPVAYGPVSLFTNERLFTARPGAEQDTDAIYVARFSPGVRDGVKRLLLAREVRSLRLVTFCPGRHWGYADAFRRTYPELAHARVNDVRLPPASVVRELERSRVQLALSAAEGCMLAFTEGLLCGVPAVSTASRSARTEFFDPESVLVCADDSRSVARAVAEMLERAPNRGAVRARALARLSTMRAEYLEYVARLAGAPVDIVARHVFDHPEGAHRLAFALDRPKSRAPGPSRKRATQ